ncbi:MAG: VanW family protein [Candidatus Parcubacteria bacterium]|nr:VanW family protein [Candidatus Parcubacteria bacterium]
MKILEILGIKKPPEKPKKRLMIELTVFFVLLIVIIFVATPVIAYESIYKNKIYSGVYIDGINVGGLVKNQAIDELNRNYDNIRNNGLNFGFKNQNYNLPITAVSPTDPDLAFEILRFKVDEMVETAYQYGRHGRWDEKFGQQLSALLNKAEMPLQYELNNDELKKSLAEKFSQFENPAQDARISFADNGEVKILPDNDGFVIDYDQALTDLKNNINLIAINSIQLKTKPAIAQVRQTEAAALLPKVQEIIALDKLVFKYQPLIDKEKIWEIGSAEYRNWLAFKKADNIVSVEFSADLIAPKFDAIGQEINVPPQDAKFQMTDGKVTEFKPALPGLELDKETSLNQLNQEFIVNKKTEITLAVKESEPNNKTEDSNTLGIKELIGKGVSDFAGSHTNRIKNIKNAVAHLNGLIIPPGEFSIVDAIGDVTAATGYFPEFVIKGDRTIPEYGGGLCQIGTTIFRVALYSGLPITERRPHSYIVNYYKPIGMDATIYGPHPDVRFLNDTGNNILLQIKIDGTELTFEFWGTSDGRKIEITDPQLFNWSGIPADKLIENPSLKPGEKKKMETGRRGADASFYRYITKADGVKAEEIFRSHYVAWPNIYEVGVQPKPEVTPVPDSTEPATSSDSTSAGQSGGTANQNINSN